MGDYIYWDFDPELSAEKIVDRAMSYEPFALRSGRRGKSFPTSSRHPPRTRGACGPSSGPALLSPPRFSPAAAARLRLG